MTLIKEKHKKGQIMRIILIISLFSISVIMNNAYSYDAVIKDNRSRVTGYLDTDGDKKIFC